MTLIMNKDKIRCRNCGNVISGILDPDDLGCFCSKQSPVTLPTNSEGSLLLSQLTSRVRETKGVNEALKFGIKYIQPIYDYFKENKITP